MGGCFSVSMSSYQVVSLISQWLCVRKNYIHNPKKNLKALKIAMKKLKAKQVDMLGKVKSLEDNDGVVKRLAEVEVWLKNVDNINSKVNGLLSTSTVELERLCVCGLCSRNLKLSYGYGKRVCLMLKEVNDLMPEEGFTVFVGPATTSMGDERPLTQKLLDKKGFLKARVTAFSKLKPNLWECTGPMIQEKFVEKLGLRGEEWNQKEESEKAIAIYKVMKRKKYQYFLDDIWEKVELTKIGVPIPKRENECKVAFTTPSWEVCRRMEVYDPIEVKYLAKEVAWKLFEKKVGQNLFRNDPEIRELAREFVRKCCGLPLALQVIGETMSYKTKIQE